jgi:hypothetical protein
VERSSVTGKSDPWELFTLDECLSATQADRNGLETYWPHLAYALDDYGLWDVPTAIACLATVSVETAHTFAPIEEYRNADGSIPSYWYGYDGGPEYHGRGFVQLTHRYNYQTYGTILGVDLVGNPALALDPSVAARVLCLYFKNHAQPDMQALAYRAWTQTGDWRPTRIYVQGGLAGWDEYSRIITALGKAIDARPQPAPADPCAAGRDWLAARLAAKPWKSIGKAEAKALAALLH